jgi:hypothetical protein
MNNSFRDDVRRFLRGDLKQLSTFSTRLSGRYLNCTVQDSTFVFMECTYLPGNTHRFVPGLPNKDFDRSLAAYKLSHSNSKRKCLSL